MKYICFLLLLLSISCVSTNSDHDDVSFEVITKTLHTDQFIQSVFVHDDYYIFRLEDSGFIVLDSTFSRRTDLETVLGKQAFVMVFVRDDTLWFRTVIEKTNSDYWSYLSDSFSIVQVDTPNFLKSINSTTPNPIYADSLFIGYVGCFGEHGGTVFFYDKEQDTVYSFPATCPKEILRIKDKYYVVSNLDHMGESTEIISIDDPRRLYHTPVFYVNAEKTETTFMMNWWVGVDSIMDVENMRDRREAYKQRGVTILDTSRIVHTLLCFAYNNRLYSIRNDTSGFVIRQYDDTGFRAVQHIDMNKHIQEYSYYKMFTQGDVYMSLRTSYKRVRDGNMYSSVQSLPVEAMIVRDGKINLLRFE